MSNEDIIKMIKEETALLDNNAEVIHVFKSGSQIFRDNPNDLDFVVICENFSLGRSKKIKKINSITYDIIIYDKNTKSESLNFNNIEYSGLQIFNYFIHFREVIYGNWNPNWNMLEYKEQYKKYLKNKYKASVGKKINKTRISKSFVHYYVPLKIFANNKIEITDEMLEDIKKLYQEGEQVLPIVNWIEEELEKI